VGTVAAMWPPLGMPHEVAERRERAAAAPDARPILPLERLGAGPLEDETGTANAFLTPPLCARWRVLLNTSSLIEVQRLLEHRDGVTHVRAKAPAAARAGRHVAGAQLRVSGAMGNQSPVHTPQLPPPGAP
jgi:hypothetical protein